MSRWNPSNPAIAGNEWPGVTVGIQTLSRSVGRGPQIIARATETIDELAALIRRTSSAEPVLVAVDVYDRANPVGPDTQSWILALPEANAGVAAGGDWVKYSGGVESGYDSTAWNHVDDLVALIDPLTDGTADQLRYNGVAPATPSYIRFTAGDTTLYNGDTGAGGQSFTGKRISSVEVHCIARTVGESQARIDGELIIGGSVYTSGVTGPLILPVNSPLTRLRFAWAANPATGLPWTVADAIALTNGTDDFGIEVITKNRTGDVRVMTMQLFFRVTTERRVATAFATASDPDEWLVLTLLDPVDNSVQAWSKVNGHEYLFLYTLTVGSGPGGMSEINSITVADDPYHPLVDAYVQQWTLDYGGVPLALVASVDGQIPTLMYAGAAVSDDSLPYGSVVDVAVANGTAIKQGISTHSTQSYGTAKIIVSRGTGGQTAPLTVTLKRTSDDVVLAGPLSIDVADVPADGKNHVVNARFPSPAALNSAVPVYLEVASASTVAWYLPALLTRTLEMSGSDPVSIDAADAGIGGATDRGGSDTTRDYPWSIGLAPNPPGTLASSVLTQANKPNLARHTVVPALIGYAHLTWAATSLGGAFGYYEIQRQDGADWNTIYIVTDESETHVNDIDCHRNIASAYRIRVVRDDGGPSAWANFPVLTVTTASPNDVIISSNWMPALSLAFADVTDGPHEWEQRRGERTETKDYYGRDFPVVWAPAEESGVRFVRDLLIGDDSDPNLISGALARDHRIFADAIALFTSTAVPALAYCDGYGKRWNVALTFLPTTRGAYVVKVTCTEVGVPAPVETDSPW